MTNEPVKVERGVLPHTYITVDANGATPTEGGVIEEVYLTVRANGYTVASMMCSPVDETALALGFLYNEGVVRSYDEVVAVEHEPDANCVNVRLSRQTVHLKRQMILTSGCGAGMTFHQVNAGRAGVETDFTTTPEVVFARMADLRGAARLYNAVRGVHAALLGTVDEPKYSAEDVGRHNAVDKIAGKMLPDGYDASQSLLLTSGRISSEMLIKAHRLNIPIVASRTAPTSTTVQLAAGWGMCVIGYVRGGSLRVYTNPWRLGLG